MKIRICIQRVYFRMIDDNLNVIVYVRKIKYENIDLCVNYAKVNSVLKKARYFVLRLKPSALN